MRNLKEYLISVITKVESLPEPHRTHIKVLCEAVRNNYLNAHHLYNLLRYLHGLQLYDLIPSEQEIDNWYLSGEVNDV